MSGVAHARQNVDSIKVRRPYPIDEIYVGINKGLDNELSFNKAQPGFSIGITKFFAIGKRTMFLPGFEYVQTWRHYDNYLIVSRFNYSYKEVVFNIHELSFPMTFRVKPFERVPATAEAGTFIAHVVPYKALQRFDAGFTGALNYYFWMGGQKFYIKAAFIRGMNLLSKMNNSHLIAVLDNN